MNILSIQEWIETIDDYYIEFSCLKKFSTNINSYHEFVQSMQKPLDFENLNEYILYCKNIQYQLHKQKLDNHITLSKKLGMIDEFYLLSQTPSEKIISEYISYLIKSEKNSMTSKSHG